MYLTQLQKMATAPVVHQRGLCRDNAEGTASALGRLSVARVSGEISISVFGWFSILVRICGELACSVNGLDSDFWCLSERLSIYSVPQSLIYLSNLEKGYSTVPVPWKCLL